MVMSESVDCQCVGSMGLHQNNFSASQHEDVSGSSFLGLGFNLNQFKNRSVIDVFRGMRDKYFGRPGIQTQPRVPTQTKESDDGEDDRSSESIDTLPVYCKLMILSFLETHDVCSVSSLNSRWRDVANDQILWRELLIRDMCKWDSMTNRSHPLISQVWNNDALKDSNDGINFVDLLYEQRMTGASVLSEVMSQNGNLERKGNASNIHENKGINFKALYIHSSFQRVQDDSEEIPPNLTIPGFIKSLWQGGAAPDQGEIIMTGPGMDSPRTSKIFRTLMWGSEFLETKGLLAGNRDGIGSGVQLIFKEKIPFNLIALYSGNNRVRETRIGMERLLHSNVVEVVNIASENDMDEGGENDNAREFGLYDAVRFYIAERRGQYKLIYVLDATVGQKWEDISCNKLELAAILKGTEFDSNLHASLEPQPDQNDVEIGQNIDEEHNAITSSAGSVPCTGKRPLLVLSCIADQNVQRFSCMQVTAMLDLPNITDRQWRVQDVTVSTMAGVEKGLEWLLRQP